MDQNWPLFAARLSGRAPSENEALLLAASRRLWPAALAAVASQVSQTSGLPLDSKSIATECWEGALTSALGTMNKLGSVKISDLDSYLFGIFSFRLNRYLARERKRQQIVEFVPESERLAELPATRDESWVKRAESRIALQQALKKTDDSFQVMAWCYSHDFSWDQIGDIFGVTGEQARKRFDYGVQKLRKLLQNPPEQEDEPE